MFATVWRCLSLWPQKPRFALLQFAVALDAERRGLERELGHCNQELQTLANVAHSGRVAGKLTDLQGRIGIVEARLAGIRAERAALAKSRINVAAATAALATFDPAWETFMPCEQARIIQLLASRVEYDGEAGKVAITLNAAGLGTLATELFDDVA